ncbi:MAG: OsmC family protein [Omnitrophica WOR_2 bacterium]
MTDTWKEVVAEWIGDDVFVGKNPTGGTVQIGTLVGRPGIGPMEMLLLGVAGCTGMDITSILRKQRQPLEKFEVRVRGLRSGTFPKVYKEIDVTYVLWGDGISQRAVEQAIQLSEDKYCSASLMMRAAGANMHSAYRILAPGETLEEAASSM